MKLEHSMLLSGYLRPFLSPSDNQSVPQSCVHGEDWTTVRLCYHSYQEVFPPYIHVSVYSASECQVVLEEKKTDLLQLDKKNADCYTLIKRVSQN